MTIAQGATACGLLSRPRLSLPEVRDKVNGRTKSARLGQVRYLRADTDWKGWKCPQRHSRTIGGTARNASASGGMAPPRMGTVPPVVHTTHRVAGTSTCRPILTSTCSSRQTTDARLYLGEGPRPGADFLDEIGSGPAATRRQAPPPASLPTCGNLAITLRRDTTDALFRAA